ncbi:hypothetical protein NBO_2g0002 [Nosema bombycis CQ1]|uniref:Uncharacterized protein n=1 Tax=Nosema bombycis (strain CQ1 / CVCC 102059) TaxID=578461 RepID=R0MMR2_NOSB1|nr:hypothetical protein NBO_2g0002 [Nosema bombycis CQ1]|eukprot:EOB15510.1 hypothetical protein NBO_2g0002 [Nosema bombycis CQ1]
MQHKRLNPLNLTKIYPITRLYLYFNRIPCSLFTNFHFIVKKYLTFGSRS